MIRAPASALTILALAWCVSANPASAADPLSTITAHVLSTSPVTGFSDGVEELAYSVRLKPVDPPGAAITAIAREPCPRGKDRDQLYSILISQRPAVLGMGVGDAAARPATANIFSCKLVASPGPVQGATPQPPQP